MERQRVAGADLSWWQMDRPENPMMITAVLWFGTSLTEDEVVDVLQRRLVDRYPKFSARLATDSGGRVWWEPVASLDVRAHVHRVRLPSPGGKVGLETYVSQVMSTRLDPDRPLWHVELVEDFEGGCALVARLHHVIADGISLARVLLQLADGSDDEPYDRTQRGALGTAVRTVRSAWRAGAHVLGEPGRWVSLARGGIDSAGVVAHLVAMPPDPPTPIRGELGIRKVAVWMPPVSVERVKATGKRLGATVNDVLMAALALALRRYLIDHDGLVPALRSFIPVNLRPIDRPIPRELGNQFGLVLLELPLHEGDAAACLAATKARMDALKSSPEALVTYAILQGLAEVPDMVENAAVDFFGAKASLITTNVPGPRERLRIVGHVMEGIMCWVPQSASVGLGVSILSYAGQVRVGVAADAHLLPDASTVVDAYARALEELEAAVG